AFEEALMEEAGYPFCAAHKRVHEVFIKRVSEYRMRFEAGEDITDDLRNMLSRWLFNHIRSDDKSYAEQVKRHLNKFAREHEEGGWLGRTLKRLFRCRIPRLPPPGWQPDPPAPRWPRTASVRQRITATCPCDGRSSIAP